MLNRYKILLFFTLSEIIFSHGISESDKTEIIQGSLMDYLYLGAKHMITGYDHILFLIAKLLHMSSCVVRSSVNNNYTYLYNFA